MRRITAGATSVRATTALLAVVLGAAACSSAAPGTGAAPAGSPLAVGVPLNSTLATEAFGVAVVPMGRLDDRDNTFWQLFFRSPGTSRWTLVTPPGVADNGGLVVTTGPTADGKAAFSLVGFEPSQDLEFSPLASSVDQGGTWSPGLAPGALAAVPDSLASSPDGGLVALLRLGGGQVFESSGDTSMWSKLVSRQALASSGAGRSCGAGELTAVALDVARAVQVGTSCSVSGVVGIFGRTGGVWRLVGPRLSGSLATSPTKVLRLVDLDGVTDALVAVRSRAQVGLIGVTGTDGGAWAHSALLPLGTGRIASTGVEPGGGFVVIVTRGSGRSALAAETGPGAGWHTLPTPPPGTATVSVDPGGVVDALAVASTQFTDWRLDTSAGRWSKIGTVTVPIQFGSSS